MPVVVFPLPSPAGEASAWLRGRTGEQGTWTGAELWSSAPLGEPHVEQGRARVGVRATGRSVRGWKILLSHRAKP